MVNQFATYVSRSCRHRMILDIVFVSILLLIWGVSTVGAFNIDTGTDWKVRWDTTFKGSTAFRVQGQDDVLTSSINADDGDRNFDPGLISARFDVLSELDITYHNFGARVSAAAWLDAMYNWSNDNDSPETFNPYSVPHDQFTGRTSALMGRYIEILDGFIFGKGNLGKFPASFRLGRHTLLWGESLFFASNGISYGQAPLDIIKALSVPATQAKELFLPVSQFSGQIQLAPNFSVAAFAQFEARVNRIPASGSYFSDADFIDDGGQRLLLDKNPSPGPPEALGSAFWRGSDLTASEVGEWGISFRYRPEQIDTDLGLYYYRYNEKSQYWAYINPTTADPSINKAGDYYLVYPENIHLIGASFGTQIGAVNVSGEVNGRLNAPLISTTQVALPGSDADNDDNALYAVGNTVHANISGIYFLGPTFLWQGGTLLAEVAAQYLVGITKNSDAFDQTRDDYAIGFRVVLEPAYYQVFSGIDLKVPIGLGYTPAGRSPVDLKFNNGGAVGGGDVSIGLNVDYLQVWKFGIKYTNFFGGRGTQTLADRDFVSLSIQRTF